MSDLELPACLLGKVFIRATRLSETDACDGPQHTGSTQPCVHHRRTDDTLLNRVLLAGLGLAASLATDVELRGHVRRLGKMLGASVSAIRLDQLTITQAWHAMDRRTSAYEPTLTLIELLFGDRGIALDEQTERVQLNGFLFDMNRFFQALISRFLHEHLSGVEIHGEYRLKGLFNYEPGQNPRGRRAPTPRPDFVVMRGAKMVSVLDAKYRDLWETPLPREMLYQLALYALGRSGNERASAILYPTVDATAREQAIAIHEPVQGVAPARVALRPVNLLVMDQLLRVSATLKARQECATLARLLAFGKPS